MGNKGGNRKLRFTSERNTTGTSCNLLRRVTRYGAIKVNDKSNETRTSRLLVSNADQRGGWRGFISGFLEAIPRETNISATVRVYRNAILKGNAIESRALYYEKNKNGTTNDLLFRLFFRLLLISHKEMCQMCLPSKEVNLNWKIK